MRQGGGGLVLLNFSRVFFLSALLLLVIISLCGGGARAQVTGTKTDISETEITTLVAGRFQNQALVAEVSATLLTALSADKRVAMTPQVLKLMVESNLRNNDLIFGSAIAFHPFSMNSTSSQFERGVQEAERGETAQGLYCPYAFRKGDEILSVDLAEGYDYTANTTDWYILPQALLHTKSAQGAQLGMWSDPYFDAGGGNIDMVTYSVPFADSKGVFMGIATIDVSLDNVVCTKDQCKGFTCQAGYEIRSDANGNSVCVPCEQGSYNLHSGKPCKPCPVGGYCPGGAKLGALHSYWTSNETLAVDDLDENEKDIVLQCNDDTCCQSAFCFVGDDAMCQQDRTGILCSQCKGESVFFGDTCIPCSNLEKGKYVFSRASFWSFVLFPLLVMVFCSMLPRPEQYLVKHSSALFNIVVEFVQLVLITISPHERIMEYHSYVSDVLKEEDVASLMRGGNGTRSGSSGLNLMQKTFSKLGFECPFEYSNLAGMYAPMQVCVIALFWALIITKIFSVLSRKFPNSYGVVHWYHNCLGGRWRVFSVVFATLVQGGFSGANCQSAYLYMDGNLTEYMYNKFYPGVKCDESSASYIAATVIGYICAVFIGIVTPAFLIYMLMQKNRNVQFLTVDLGHQFDSKQRMAKLKTVGEEFSDGVTKLREGTKSILTKPRTSIMGAIGRRNEEKTNAREKLTRRIRRLSPDQVDVLRKYGWLYLKFKPSYRLFMQSAGFLRRTFYIIIFVVVSRLDDDVGDARARGTALLLVSVLFLVMQTLTMPYLSKLDNAYSVFCFAVLTLIAGIQVAVHRLSHELGTLPALDDSTRRRRIEAAQSIEFFSSFAYSLLLLWLVATVIIIVHYALFRISRSYARTTSALKVRIRRILFDRKEVKRFMKKSKMLKEQVETGRYDMTKQGSFIFDANTPRPVFETKAGFEGSDDAIMHINPMPRSSSAAREVQLSGLSARKSEVMALSPDEVKCANQSVVRF